MNNLFFSRYEDSFATSIRQGVTVHSVHSNALRDAQKSSIRMISRRTSRVFCELCSQKTSRRTLPVNSNRTGYCERSLLISRNIFNDRGIYVIFIQTHLHLHRCGIVGEFHSSEVVKEEQDAETDTDGIGDFQNSIAGCGLSGDLGVDLLK